MTYQHNKLKSGNIHTIVNWNVATLIDRDALLVTADDIGKVVKVGTATLFWLSGISPNTWSEMGGGGGTVPSGTGGIFDGGDRLSTDSTYDGGNRL